MMDMVTKLRLLRPGALAAVLSTLLAAQTAAPVSAPAPTYVLKGRIARDGSEQAASTNASDARVRHVMVRGTPGAIEVEIQTSGGPVAPDTQVVTGPDRIIVDFPGALPAADLRALRVNRGALKAIRAGLFFNNPPITRVVLDLAEPQSYQISTLPDAVVVKLGAAQGSGAELNPVNFSADRIRGLQSEYSKHDTAATGARGATAKLQNAVLGANTAAVAAYDRVSRSAAASVAPVRTARQQTDSRSTPPAAKASPPQPSLVVTYENGLLQIHSDKATMSQVLFEVQRQTQAEIAIPSGAEQEQVAVDIGPASSREVLASLLNGSAYNFIFVGTEEKLERVILTRRGSSAF